MRVLILTGDLWTYQNKNVYCNGQKIRILIYINLFLWNMSIFMLIFIFLSPFFTVEFQVISSYKSHSPKYICAKSSCSKW